LVRSFDPILTQDPRVGYRRRFDVSAAAGTRSSTFDDVRCGRVACSGWRGVGRRQDSRFLLPFGGGARASCVD
jgi:hypothetical protein